MLEKFPNRESANDLTKISSNPGKPKDVATYIKQSIESSTVTFKISFLHGTHFYYLFLVTDRVLVILTKLEWQYF